MTECPDGASAPAPQSPAPPIARPGRTLRAAWVAALLAVGALSTHANAAEGSCNPSFDIDGNGRADALTDGLLVLRHLFAFSGASLVDGAVAADAHPATDDATEITSALDCRGDLLDIDGDGNRDALTDGLLLSRYLFGFRDAALTVDALSPTAIRRNGGTLDAWLHARLTVAAFGLPRRAPLTSQIPTDPPPPVSGITITRAFPALTFSTPIFLAGVPGEDRNVVIEQGGRMYAFANIDTVPATARTLVLDIRDRVLFNGEQGLLGLAFDPDFERNRAFYVHYSARGTGRTTIARYIWDAATDRADAASEHIFLSVDQPFSNHNGGMIAFGPDGQLYIALGDGGSGNDPQNNSQDRSNLLGKVLRITPPPVDSTATYGIPADNPFVGLAGVRSEIWAYGLRNPFRFSFDRETGRLWLGDVGQTRREEIDLIERGGNYGWRIFEGSEDNQGVSDLPVPGVTYLPPIHDYGRSVGTTVIGGYVSRGSDLPALYGSYVYGDAGSGRIFALQTTGNSVVNTPIGNVSSLYSFGEDASGRLLAVSGAGRIFQFGSSTGGGSAPPALLSQTGIFADLSTLTATPAFVEYEINHAFWTDGTLKRRWLAVPDAARIGFDAAQSFVFPVGSLLVKHFELETETGNAATRKRMETRVLARRESGWYGLVYRWREDGSDAELLADAAFASVTVTGTAGSETFDYEFPSRGACLRCHNDAAGGALGIESAQLNRTFAYPTNSANQLQALDHAGYFTTAPPDPATLPVLPAIDGVESVDERARTYLDVNCSNCHRPDGGTPVNMDLRRETALEDANIIDVAPSGVTLGIANARRVAPGDSARSVLLARMQRADALRMPPVSTHRVDAAGVALIDAWINALPPP